jgi:hypothetical protein
MGPVKPVPPRIRMRRLFAALPVVATPDEKADTAGISPKPAVPPNMAESLRKVLLVIDIYFCSPEISFQMDTDHT